MSGPIYFSGVIDLKPGTTYATIEKLYVEEGCAMDAEDFPDPDEPTLDLTGGNGELVDWADEVNLKVEGDQLDYTVNMSDGSYDFVGNFEDFLKRIASEYATKGWPSWEGEPGDDQTVNYYGPTEEARSEAELVQAKEEFRHAISALLNIRDRHEKLTGQDVDCNLTLLIEEVIVARACSAAAS